MNYYLNVPGMGVNQNTALQYSKESEAKISQEAGSLEKTLSDLQKISTALVALEFNTEQDPYIESELTKLSNKIEGVIKDITKEKKTVVESMIFLQALTGPAPKDEPPKVKQAEVKLAAEQQIPGKLSSVATPPGGLAFTEEGDMTLKKAVALFTKLGISPIFIELKDTSVSTLETLLKTKMNATQKEIEDLFCSGETITGHYRCWVKLKGVIIGQAEHLDKNRAQELAASDALENMQKMKKYYPHFLIQVPADHANNDFNLYYFIAKSSIYKKELERENTSYRDENDQLVYKCKLSVNEQEIVTCTGDSKLEASQEAHKKALLQIQAAVNILTVDSALKLKSDIAKENERLTAKN